MSYGYEETVYRAVLSTLKAAQAVGQPLNFVGVNSIYDSAFPKGSFIASMPPNAFPAIGMEPDVDVEKFFTTGTPPALTSAFGISLVLALREGKAENGLLGDPTQNPPVIGMLEFVRRVKNVLQTDQSLGGTAGLQKMLFPKTDFVYDYYPVRICNLSVLLTGQLTTQSH